MRWLGQGIDDVPSSNWMLKKEVRGQGMGVLTLGDLIAEASVLAAIRAAATSGPVFMMTVKFDKRFQRRSNFLLKIVSAVTLDARTVAQRDTIQKVQMVYRQASRCRRDAGSSKQVLLVLSWNQKPQIDDSRRRILKRKFKMDEVQKSNVTIPASLTFSSSFPKDSCVVMAHRPSRAKCNNAAHTTYRHIQRCN